MFRISVVFTAMTVFFPIVNCVAQQRSWPGWMGKHHDGVSDESDWSVDWPATGLPVKWSRDIGIGFSSVSIADGRLCTMGHQTGCGRDGACSRPQSPILPLA